MTAEALRKAANLMRERAEVATSGPWADAWLPEDPDACDGPVVVAAATEVVTEWHVTKPDAEHIASWHPAVALAVADWLTVASVDWPENPEALAVARAYLGMDA